MYYLAPGARAGVYQLLGVCGEMPAAACTEKKAGGTGACAFQGLVCIPGSRVFIK